MEKFNMDDRAPLPLRGIPLKGGKFTNHKLDHFKFTEFTPPLGDRGLIISEFDLLYYLCKEMN